MESCVELNSSYHSNSFAWCKVSFQRCEEMRSVNADIDKNVECFNLRSVDRDKTAMCIMYEYITPKCPRSVIIYTTSTVGDVCHDKAFNPRTEGGDDVGDCSGKKEETFREL